METEDKNITETSGKFENGSLENAGNIDNGAKIEKKESAGGLIEANGGFGVSPAVKTYTPYKAPDTEEECGASSEDAVGNAFSKTFKKFLGALRPYPADAESAEQALEKTPPFKQGFYIILVSIIRAISMNVFVLPNKIAPGGISGIASILYNTLGWNAPLVILVMNIPLMVLAFFFINKRFVIATTISTAVFTGLMQLFTYLPIPTFTGNVLVAALVGGILSGISLSLLLRINCSSGGSDIVGLLIQNRFPNFKVVWLVFIMDACVAASAGIVFGSLELAIYSLITIFMSSFAAEFMQRTFVSTLEFKIITKKEEEITRFVLSQLHHGVTHIDGIGMYTGNPVNYLVCVVRKRQALHLKRYISLVDPEAFYYVTELHDIVGKGFNNDVNPRSKIK
ncbi:MAG: YitT family protein [Christensenellales bacterium]|jgi:uncharacterized membrane-anchored protein YitT (DUF2179 family)|nr:YitT family protein [Eubacteriales bacterium]